VDLGFSLDQVLTARLALPSRGYKEGADETALTFRRVLENLRVRPGVAAAALSSQAPMGPGGGSNGLVPEGKPLTRESALLARMRMVTPGYFSTLRIRLVRGHFFTDADVRGGPRVIVVSEAAAKALWPGKDAVGKRLACCEGGTPGDPAWKTVVGVVSDVRSAGPARDATPEFYMPMAQVPVAAWDWIQRAMTITVRSAGPDPTALAGTIRAAVRAVDPGLPVFRVNTMRDDLRGTLAQARFNTALLLALGLAGLLLAAVGIGGVISYFVSLRTHEIGLRMALGASGNDVLRLMTLQAARPMLAGVVLGTCFAAWGTRFLRDALTGVDARDPLTFGAVALLLVAVGFAATLVPALRATRISPTQALQG
jgi:predicted permease